MTSAASQAGLIARRELIEGVRTKAFRNGTIGTVVLVVAIVAAFTVLPALLGDDEPTLIGYLEPAAGFAEALPDEAGGERIGVLAFLNETAARQALTDETVEAVLLDGSTVLTHDGLSPRLHGLLTSAASTARLAEALGATPEEVVASATAGLEITELDPTDPEVGQRRAMTMFGVFAVLGQVMGGAFMLAYGVVEEKASRVVEVVLSRTRPRTLLTGKLIGIGAVNLIQLAVIVGAALLAVAVFPDLSIPSGLLGASGLILVWFLLAYAIFGSLFAIGGALTARQEDMQQRIMPAMYLLFLIFGAVLYVTSNPESTLSVIATFVPFTAPAVVPLRDAVIGLPGWQMALAMLSTAVGAAVAIWIAGSVYSGGALRMRGRTTVREAIQADV